MILTTSHHWRRVYRWGLCACLALLMVWLLRDASHPQAPGPGPPASVSADTDAIAVRPVGVATPVVAAAPADGPADASGRERERCARLLRTPGMEWTGVRGLARARDMRAVPLLAALCAGHDVPARRRPRDPAARDLTPQWAADRLADLIGTARTPEQWATWFEQRRHEYDHVRFHHAYQVRGGDNLTEISRRVYGHTGAWEAIYRANRDRMISPHVLSVGQVLAIPEPDPTRARAVADASGQGDR